MGFRTNIPPNASVVVSSSDGRLLAPSAEKNAGPIADLVKEFASERGEALEIASGTGQHIVKLAIAKPNLNWQPSDIDQLRISSIKTWCNDYNFANVSHQSSWMQQIGWSTKFSSQTFILLVNLMHLISKDEAKILITEVASALALGGVQ